MAHALQIAADHPSRVRARLRHLLHDAAKRGHMFLPRSDLLAQAMTLLCVPAAAIAHLLAIEIAGLHICGSHDDAPIYLTELYEAEGALARSITALSEGAPPPALRA